MKIAHKGYNKKRILYFQERSIMMRSYSSWYLYTEGTELYNAMIRRWKILSLYIYLKKWDTKREYVFLSFIASKTSLEIKFMGF